MSVVKKLLESIGRITLKVLMHSSSLLTPLIPRDSKNQVKNLKNCSRYVILLSIFVEQSLQLFFFNKKEEKLVNVPLLIFANKQDLMTALPPDEVD